MAQATLFKNNKNQAIRLPKSFSFPDGIKHVEIIKVKEGLLITPVEKSWNSWFEDNNASEDFMASRMQEPMQERESF